jgi:hypothetical protein
MGLKKSSEKNVYFEIIDKDDDRGKIVQII